MNTFESWIYDDITWCGNECSYTKCERNLSNRISKTGMYSAAMFKDTDMCPLRSEERERKSNMGFSDGENK